MRHPLPVTRILLLSVAAALLAAAPTGLAEQKNGQNKGSGKGGGGGTESLAPVSLGNPADIGCSSTEIHRVSLDGSFAVGMANGCGQGIYNQPFLYTASSRTLDRLGDSTAVGWATDASETGLAVGFHSPAGPTVFDADTATALPLPDGFTPGQANAITDDGLLVAGYAGTPDGPSYALVWIRDGDDWVAEQIEDHASSANAVIADGGGYRIVGSADGQAVMWTGAPGSWVRRDLAPDRSRAEDISADGTVIVGTHWLPYDTHVAWIEDENGDWTEQVLKGADPSFDEGMAFGVGQLADGSIVAAGFSWQDTAGKGGTKWAVAWRLDVGTRTFRAPILLPPMNKKWGAGASDVSPTGEVFGTASTGSGSLAVKWALPR